MRIRRRATAESGLDISPLIDMVFILLIFFMVSTTFVKDLKVDLERPKASSAQRASTKAIRVHLDRGGNVYLDLPPTDVLDKLLATEIGCKLATSCSTNVDDVVPLEV